MRQFIITPFNVRMIAISISVDETDILRQRLFDLYDNERAIIINDL